MATRRNSKTQPVIEATEQDGAPVEATTNIPDLGAVIDNLPETIESSLQALADEAAAAHAESTENDEVEKTTSTPAPKAARKRVGANGIISQPGGSKSKYGIPGGAAWSFPKDGFVLAFAKLLALQPMTIEEASCIIHGQDSDGNPARKGTTQVYTTWDLPRKGFGVERKDGKLSVLMPEGRDIQELRKIDSMKLDGLIEARSRADLAALVDEAREGSDKDGTEEGI